MKNDEMLMKEYQQGSEEAFSLLYEKYSSMVYSFIKRRLRESEVDDFYQKVWRQLHEKRHLFTDQPFAPWFFVLIKHLLIDEYRSLGRRVMNKDFQEELKENLIGPNNAVEEVEDYLTQLPLETQELVRKYYLEGVSYEDLAGQMGLSQTNLRQRLSRALRGLRKLYEE